MLRLSDAQIQEFKASARSEGPADRCAIIASRSCRSWKARRRPSPPARAVRETIRHASAARRAGDDAATVATGGSCAAERLPPLNPTGEDFPVGSGESCGWTVRPPVRAALDKVEDRGAHGAHRAGGQAGLRRLRHSGAEGRRRRPRPTEAAKLAAGHGLSRRAEDRLAGDPAQDRGRRRAGRCAARPRRRSRASTRSSPTPTQVRRQGRAAGRAGAADAGRRPGGHRRRASPTRASASWSPSASAACSSRC